MGRLTAATCSLVTIAWLAVLVLLVSTEALAVGPGQWTPPKWWGGNSTNNRYAVHMMLLAGDGAPYHSRILWYGGLGGGENLRGGEWGWTPGSDGCSSYPASNFTLLTPADPGMDLFCGGHAILGDGRALLVGGTEHHSGSYGVRGARLFTPGTGMSAGSWSSPHPGELAERRWYPTATTLRDGRVLALAGSQYLQHRVFGGRVEGASPASPRADSVHRIVPIMGEPWDSSVLPSPDPSKGRPEPREAHTGIDMTEVAGFGGQVFFGGLRGSDARVLNDVWQLQRADSLYGADYVYKWKQLEPVLMGSPQPPLRRREHTAVKDGFGQMIVFGGRDSLDRPLGDVWRLYWNPDPTKLRLEWAPVTVSGAAPSARYGHSAYFESRLLVVPDSVPQWVDRMIVYGGAEAGGPSPVDRKVYELRFSSPSTATWYEMPETTLTDTSTHPAPRKGHAVGWGDKQRYRTGGSPAAHTAYVFGGELAGGAYSDSMWTLWTFRTGKFGWDLRLTSNIVDAPGPRARFSMVTDNLQGGHAGDSGPRLHIFGGENASGLADRFVYVIDPFTWGVPQPPAAWNKWEAGPVAVAGHVALLETRDVHARVAEVFDPASGARGTWTNLPDALLQQPFYPLVFTISGGSSAGGRVATASTANSVTHYLDLPGPGQTSGNWQPFTNGDVGFVPQSGVLYRPNKLMVAGGQSITKPYPVVGTTKSLDASSVSSSWMTSDSMTPRYYHNLVQLPDGKVLAVGGNATTNRNNDAPILRPQLWDPDGNNGAGTWTPMSGADTLHASTLKRGYHSTALLLPDARVLVSGGENDSSKYYADIFCPPYLFNADGSLATRPVIQASPRHVSFGQTFIVGVNQGANVASMCLVRPAATTHGFDENQRFVPLSYALTALNAPGGTYYKVTVPSDSSVVPPGDYLLFVLNAGGTPSVARWVRIGRTNGSTSQPTTVTNLHKQCSDGTSVTLLWSPPGTDVGDPVLAPAQSYDIRYRTGAMNTWPVFRDSGIVVPPPVPSDPTVSTEDNVTINFTQQDVGQTYWFRLAAKNHASGSGNWSALSNQISFVIHNEECGGSGGGGGGGGYEEGASIRPTAQGYSAGSWRPGPGTSDSAYVENTLLPNAVINVATHDLLRLPLGPRWTTDGARVRLSRTGKRATHFDRVRLLAVDHAAGEGVFVRGGELVSGVTHDPLRVTHADGRDLSEMFLAGGAFEGRDGDTLYLDLGGDGPGSLALTTSRAQLVRAPDRTGIDVASMGATGWAEVGHHDVRERASDEVFDVPELRRVRLVFRGVHDLQSIARFTPGSAVAVTAHSPSAAEHSRLGPVAESFAAGDGTALSPGDHMLVDFAASPPEEGASRAWFLDVLGTHLEAAGGAQLARLADEAEVRPAAFALAAVRPNPSPGRTTIEFDVPRSAQVRVEVFDVLGRRVATLADATFPAGRHAIAWDGATSAGERVRAGVYLCRMTAGEFRARRTLVLRP